MDSSNFVPPAIGIPAGPLSQADPQSQKGGIGKPVAAIIRPIPRESGKEGSLRLDPAQPGVAKAHVRTNQLDDYVRWLRAKIKAEQAKPKRGARPVETAATTARAATTQRITVTVKPAASAAHFTTSPELTSQQHVMPGSYFSTVTTQAGLTDQDLTVADDISTNNLQRIDQPHNIDGGLPSAHASFDEASLIKPKDVPHNISAESNLAPTGIESDNTESPGSEPTKLTVEDTEDFIAAVSQAIASVLTDMPEPDFEQKVRTHFETELHARAIGSITTSSVKSEEPVVSDDEVDKMDRTVLADLADVAGRPVLTMQSEANQVASEILHGAMTEIPTSVAAWDVEDFRWPLITNQMIVSGGEALDRLYQSTLELISPTSQRVAIAGLGRGEGTTSIALSLARWSAACGKNVLLIDADLVTPGLSRQVGLAPNLSWINAVSQSLSPAEVIVRSQKSNLCVMPLAQMVSRVTWPRFIYDNLGDVISQVQSHFDLIILDTGPANQLMGELSRPGLLVDAMMLVHDGVSSPEFKQTKNRLEVFGINKFIVAQNRATRKTNVA